MAEETSVGSNKPNLVEGKQPKNLSNPTAVINSEEGTTQLIKITYPKDYKGVKHFIDGGTYEVANDAVELFIEKGIAEIVE